ncbi:MAG: hypothetical protein M0017_01215 [Desulfobacteraceae bacterium]|nr:hypothetical protein [Desulfobacteraceae bacterium]
MAAPVIIVESEAKAALLRSQLGKEMEVAVLPAAPAKASWLVPKDKLKRAMPRFGFAPLPAARPLLDRLHAAQDRDIYLALENNVQGEYWSWLLSGHLAEVTKGRLVPGRLRLCGLNREEIQQGLRLVDTIREEAAIHAHIRLLLNACLGKHLDRLLGTRYGPQNLPLDFCTLAVLGLLREREAELAAHTPPVRWQVRTTLACDDRPLAARLSFAFGLSEDGLFGQAAEAKAAIELFQGQPAIVREIRREETLLEPPPPYRWPELVQEAFRLHGFSPLLVIRSLEELAAGVQLDGGPVALIGSSWCLAPVSCASVAGRCKAYLAGQGTAAGDTGDGTEPEGGGLSPLRPEIGPERLPPALPAEARIIYGMIRSRALASQMTPARVETAEVVLGAGDACRFSAALRRVLAPGFLDLPRPFTSRICVSPPPSSTSGKGRSLPSSRSRRGRIPPRPSCTASPPWSPISRNTGWVPIRWSPPGWPGWPRPAISSCCRKGGCGPGTTSRRPPPSSTGRCRP